MNVEDFMNACSDKVNAAADAATADPDVIDAKDVEKKRKELLEARDAIKKSESQISKANAKTILKWHTVYESAAHELSVVFLCDMFLSKFATILGITNMVDKPEDLEEELKKDPLLRIDLKSGMSKLTPIIPFLGLLSGGLTVGKHVYNHTPDVKQSGKEGTGEEPKKSHPSDS